MSLIKKNTSRMIALRGKMFIKFPFIQIVL